MIENTILQQLGGHGFTVMTGSRNYINLGNGLQMSLAPCKKQDVSQQTENHIG